MFALGGRGADGSGQPCRPAEASRLRLDGKMTNGVPQQIEGKLPAFIVTQAFGCSCAAGTIAAPALNWLLMTAEDFSDSQGLGVTEFAVIRLRYVQLQRCRRS